MCRNWFLLVLLSGLIPSLWSDGIDRKGAFSYYQTILSEKESGAYEWNGLLFIHVRQHLDRTRQSVSKVRSDALHHASQILMRWAVERTECLRVFGSETPPPGVVLARRLVTAHDPLWLCRDWQITARMRAVPEKAGIDTFVMGQVFEIAELESVFPAKLRQPVQDVDWISALVPIVRYGLAGSDRRSFLIECGALDGVCDYVEASDATPPQGIPEEYAEANARLSHFIKDSEMGTRFRSQADRIRGPVVSSVNVSLPCPVSESVRVNTVSVTNFFNTACSKTNSTGRSQMASEIDRLGLSEGGSVLDVATDIEYGEIETKIIRVSVQTTTSRLHRVTHTVSGNPAFQEFFLGLRSCGGATQQRSSGKHAVDVYFGQTPLEEKVSALERALAENPGDRELWNLYGRCHMVSRQFEAAIICFRLSIRLSGDYAYAWANLAEAYQSIGSHGLAVGAAIIARGLALDEWCRQHAEKVLLAVPVGR